MNRLLISFYVSILLAAYPAIAEDAASLASLTAAVQELIDRVIVPDTLPGRSQHVSSAARPLLQAAVDALSAGDTKTAEARARDVQTTIPAITAYDSYEIRSILAVSHCRKASISSECADGLAGIAMSPYGDDPTRVKWLSAATVIHHALHDYKASYTLGQRAIALGAVDYSTFAATADSFYVQRMYHDAGETLEKWLTLQRNCVPSSNTIFFAHEYYDLAHDAASASRVYSTWPPVDLKGT